MRGENFWFRHLVPGDNGSSPLARGKHLHAPTRRLAPRIIPACAGKTFEVGRDYTHYPAHPRVSGENPPGATCTPVLEGSSPRERGKLMLTVIFLNRVRLIPA